MAGVARAQPCRPQQEVHTDGRLNGRSLKAKTSGLDRGPSVRPSVPILSMTRD